MDRDPRQRFRIAVGDHGGQRIDQVGRRLRQRQRIPAQAVGGQGIVEQLGGVGEGALEWGIRGVLGRGSHAVEPGATILVARRGESGARKLLGIEAEGGTLGRVAALGQGAGHGFGGEMVAEAGKVGGVGHCCGLARGT